MSNGLLLCSFHHHLVHEGGWELKVDGRTGEAIFTPPGGHELRTTPKGLPATLPPTSAAPLPASLMAAEPEDGDAEVSGDSRSGHAATNAGSPEPVQLMLDGPGRSPP